MVTEPNRFQSFSIPQCCKKRKKNQKVSHFENCTSITKYCSKEKHKIRRENYCSKKMSEKSQTSQRREIK